MSRINPVTLRVIRERSGYSLRDLADLTGLSFSYIADIESGRRNPPDRTVQKLADGLGVPAAALRPLGVAS